MATRAMARAKFPLGVLVQKDLGKDSMGCLLTPGSRLEVLPASPCVALASGGDPGGLPLTTASCPGGSGRRRLFLALLGQLCVMSVCRPGAPALVKALLSYSQLRLNKPHFPERTGLVFLRVESREVLLGFTV